MTDTVGEKSTFPILSHTNLFFERKKILTLNKRNWIDSLFFCQHGMTQIWSPNRCQIT